MDNQFTSIDKLKKVIMDNSIITEYIVDETDWSYDDKVKFIQLMVAGLYTGSVVYHLDHLKNINTIYRGCNIVRTLTELFSDELPVSPSMFTLNSSVEKVKFSELPLPVKRCLSNGKLMMFRIHSNAMYDSCLKKEDFINMFSEI